MNPSTQLQRVHPPDGRPAAPVVSAETLTPEGITGQVALIQQVMRDVMRDGEHFGVIPGTQKPGLYPWFAVPGMRRRDVRVVCGHWSALGRFAGLGVYAIDTGCVWGGKLTALQLDAEEPRYVTVNAEPHRKRPPGGED